MDETLGGLLVRAKDELANLVRIEIERARRETIGKIKQLGFAIAAFAIGLVFALFAFVALTAALIAALDTVVAPWLAATIVTVVYAVTALAAALLGKNLIGKALPPLPTSSLRDMKEDARWISKRINSKNV